MQLSFRLVIIVLSEQNPAKHNNQYDGVSKTCGRSGDDKYQELRFPDMHQCRLASNGYSRC
jgi:hypothetical protein